MDVDVCLSCDRVEMRCTDKGWAPSTMEGEGWSIVVMAVTEGSKAGTKALVTTTSSLRAGRSPSLSSSSSEMRWYCPRSVPQRHTRRVFLLTLASSIRRDIILACSVLSASLEPPAFGSMSCSWMERAVTKTSGLSPYEKSLTNDHYALRIGPVNPSPSPSYGTQKRQVDCPLLARVPSQTRCPRIEISSPNNTLYT